ncbi:LPS export ABC transporter periplasmic protein LptC [Marinilabilia salmonicolor]|uniref:LPS export ABC transporter periplasmic protein LptC n=1 Tax=Marinilabilia salmonicolor TaxID=989 RepID=UPI00029B40D0|nr:LPS export ABC transporter periplasmic protein LptC [Marinilabilia salmonicolor]
MNHRFKHDKSKIQTAGSIFLLLAVLVLFTSCQSNTSEEIQAAVDEENLPSLSVKDLETAVTDSGRIAYRFITPEMNQYENLEKPYTEFPEGLHLIIYNQQEEIDAQIKSKYAIYHESEDLWELQNDVEAVNFKNEVINTEQLFWDSRKHIIYSDEFIKITTDKEILTGYGFESDERLENYTIKRISGILSVQENQSE